MKDICTCGHPKHNHTKGLGICLKSSCMCMGYEESAGEEPKSDGPIKPYSFDVVYNNNDVDVIRGDRVLDFGSTVAIYDGEKLKAIYATHCIRSIIPEYEEGENASQTNH